MQPFLLLKQTLEASFDPGPILVYGPNVQLTDWTQALSRGKNRDNFSRTMLIGISIDDFGVTNTYEWSPESGLALAVTTYTNSDMSIPLTSQSKPAEIESAFKIRDKNLLEIFGVTRARKGDSKGPAVELAVVRDRCFLEPALRLKAGYGSTMSTVNGDTATSFENFLTSIVHVPGLRGNPARTYTSSAVKNRFPGTMEQYVASVVSRWQTGGEVEKKRLRNLSTDLERLGLTWKIDARKINDASVELRVGRLPHAQQGGAQDVVNIVDVGFGVSQTLPVLVALHAAEPGQTVYIEQPEIHLHPRAQVILGELLVEASNRGIKVIAETHSSLILRAVQTAIAKKNISHRDVALNWFYRDEVTGFSAMDSAEIDSLGRVGDWPVDFDEVSEKSDWDFIDSVQRGARD